MSAAVKDIDRGWRRVKVELLKLTDDRALVVGVIGEEAAKRHGNPEEAAPTVAEIATWHEFGTHTGVPERSFARATVDEHASKYVGMLNTGLGKVVDGKMTVPQVLGLLGARVVGDMRNRIRAGIDPALKPATIQRKTRISDGAEASTPLILTGQLLRALSWAIRGRSEGEAGGSK